MKESDFIVEADEHYLKEIGLKASLPEQDHNYYYAELPGCKTVLPISTSSFNAFINLLLSR